MALDSEALSFSENFIWSVATAPAQVEEDTVSDWAGEFRRIGAIAPGHLRLFEADLALLKQLGVNAYRLGIDWARLQPAPYAGFDESAVATYRTMLTHLREAGIAPMVTLHHFANPVWLPPAGWKDGATVDYFVDFVKRAIGCFSDVVDSWVIINEPEVYVLDKFIVGVFPPYRKWAFLSAYRELRNMAKAVRMSAPLLRGTGARVITIAKNLRLFHPYAGRVSERIVSGLLNRLYNDWIFKTFFFERGEPLGDMIGINYYGPTRIKGGKPFIPGVFPKGELDRSGTFDDLQELDPCGLREALEYVKRKTALPIIILENGTGSDDDQLRQQMLESHLRELSSAIRDGHDVRGYTHWSLLDNIEWNFGNSIRFGLVKVSPRISLERSLKPSGLLYSAVCHGHSQTSKDNRD